jgi:hypothetical protein
MAAGTSHINQPCFKKPEGKEFQGLPCPTVGAKVVSSLVKSPNSFSAYYIRDSMKRVT